MNTEERTQEEIAAEELEMSKIDELFEIIAKNHGITVEELDNMNYEEMEALLTDEERVLLKELV